MRCVVASILVTVSLIIAGCAEKPPFPSAPVDAVVPAGDTVYVEIFPPWVGFQDPRALIVGNDQLFYAADYGNNRVVMLNAAGQVLGERSFLRPVALAQDSRLDLLVGGEVIRASGDTIGALFRLHVVKDREGTFYGHAQFSVAPVETVWTEPSRPHRRFVGIAVMPNNQYLVARTGPDNSSFVDPDSRILLFNKGDSLVTPLGDLVTRAGSGITDINRITNIAAFPGRRDFIVTQSSEGVSYGTVWMVYYLSSDFEGWLPRFDPSDPEDRNIDFVRPGRFSLASAAAFDRRRGDIFVVDAALDSVFKFNSRGRFRPESFGEALTRNSRFPDGLTRPSGIAFFERTLYVVDTGNNAIRLFRLSTDLF